MVELNKMIHDLVGCAWGRDVWLEDDPDPCQERADSITVLHDGPRELAVKLCPKHKSRIIEETTPRKS